MFEYKEFDLLGPKSALDSGQGPSLYCSATGAAEDQLAELARLVGGNDQKEAPKSPLLRSPTTTPVQLVDDAPALEFDLEGELSRVFEGSEEETTPSASPVDELYADETSLPSAAPHTTPATEEPVSMPVFDTAAAAPADPPVDDEEDLLGDVFEQALAEEVAADEELQTLASKSDTTVELDDLPIFEPEEDSNTVNVTEANTQVARRSLATPTAASGMPNVDEMAEAIAGIDATPAKGPSNDFKDELARLLGQTPGAPSAPEMPEIPFEPVAETPVDRPSAPMPPKPDLMAAPWSEPEIVATPNLPSSEEAYAPAAEAPSFQPPQMSDFETLASDYSDPAADLEDFLERQNISSSDTTLEKPMSRSDQPIDTPAPVAPPMPAMKNEAVDVFEPSPIDAAFDKVRLDAAVAGVAGVGAGVAMAAAARAQPAAKPTFAAANPSAPVQPSQPINANVAEPKVSSPSKQFDHSVSLDPVADYEFDSQINGEIDDSILDEELEIPDQDSTMAFVDKRGKGRKAAFAIVALALLGGASVVGWNAMQGDSGPAPTILASSDPIKVKPEDAGGKVVPNQDQAVYQSVDGEDQNSPKQDRLNDSSEKPIEVSTNAAGKSDSRVVESGEATTSGLVLKPRRVRTVVVKPDGTIVSTNAEAPATGGVGINEPVLALRPLTSGSQPTTSDQPRTVTYSAPQAKTAEEAPAPKPVEVARVEPKPVETTSPETTKAEPKPETTPPAAVDADGLPSQKSPFAVQVSSQRSAAAAKQTYATLSKRYAGIIGGKGVDIQKATIQGRGDYYRVRIPAETRGAANKICSQLKANGGDCFVTR